MIRHLVMFTLTADDAAQRDADIAAVRARLEDLVGVIPGLRTIAFEPDLGLVEGHKHVVLVSDHKALEGYQVHPGHIEAAALIRAVTGPARAIVDYEL